MVEGCAVASVLGMLEEREAAARVRVEGLREEVARLAEVLEAAEIELDRRVIAREELIEALAVSAAESTAVTTTEAEEEAAPCCPGARLDGAALAGGAAGDGAGAGLPADSGRAGERPVRARAADEPRRSRWSSAWGRGRRRRWRGCGRRRSAWRRAGGSSGGVGAVHAGRRPVAGPGGGS